MPYIIAATLIDRAFSDEVFADERLRDPRIQQLMDKIEVKEDKEITRQFPDKLKCRIEIATKGGGRKIAETDYPRGHYKNPMNDDEVNTKFRGLAQRALSKDGVERALDALWQLDSAKDLGAIFKAVKVTH